MKGRNGWLGGENQNEGSRQRETRWLTPRWIVDSLGRFDLDPCGAPDHALADRTYLPERGEDGLSLPWSGRVWLNPPYGKLMAPFIERLSEHGRGTALLFARTETNLFFDFIWPTASAVLFLKGRLSFLDAYGVPAAHNSGAPSALIAYGELDATHLADSGIPGVFVPLQHTVMMRPPTEGIIP